MEQHGRIDWSICNAQIAKGNVMQPMNYTIQTPKSGELLSGALTMAGQMAQRDQFLANADKARAEQQAILAQQEENKVKQQELLELSRDPTAKKVQEFIIRRPELAAQFKDSYANLSDNEKRTATEVNFLIKSGLESGKQDVVVSEIDRRIEAAKNSGDAVTADKLDVMKNLVIANPNAARLTANAFLASTMDPEKFANMEKTRGEESRAAELQPISVREKAAQATTAEVKAKFAEEIERAGITEKVWNVRNVQNQIAVRGAQLQLDRQRLAVDTAAKMAEVQSKLTEIPAGSQKLVNDAAVTAGAAKQQAETYADLSKRITTIGSSWGAAGSANEWLKKAAGMQDGVTAIRQEYTRLRNSAAVASLPPGPATDKDIQMVLEGFPPANASPQVISGFLRGMAKLKDIEASVEGAKVDWLANNRGVLTRANTSFQAGSQAVTAGESFSDFSARVAKDVSAKYAAPVANQANTDLLRQADAIISGGR
jgi:hypothetical protein